MSAVRGGRRTLMWVSLVWGLGWGALILLLHLFSGVAELLPLLIMPFASLVMALNFTLYEWATLPRPFSWRSLLVFDGFMILFAGAGWLVFCAEASQWLG